MSWWKRFDEYLRDISLNVRRQRELDLNRRGFIATTFGLIALFFLGSLPFMTVFAKEKVADKVDKRKPPFRIAGNDELQIGESKPYFYPRENDPALLVRLGENYYVSYHIKCTHLQCPVYWEPNQEVLMCPCHNGFFDVKNGAPLAGPPRRPLPMIELDITSDGIFAVGIVDPEV